MFPAQCQTETDNKALPIGEVGTITGERVGVESGPPPSLLVLPNLSFLESEVSSCPRASWDRDAPVDRIKDTTENVTIPRIACTGGDNYYLQ